MWMIQTLTSPLMGQGLATLTNAIAVELEITSEVMSEPWLGPHIYNV